MNHTIKCTLSLLGAGALGAHAGNPQALRPENRTSPGREASYSVTVAPAEAGKSILISPSGKKEAEYTVVTASQPAKAASWAITVSPKGKEEPVTGKAAYSVVTVPGAADRAVPLPEPGGKSPDQPAVEKDDRAVIQIALLLDTSGSMQGLIDQARTYLWKIVNSMTLARQNGKLPAIRIALYEYGSGRLSSENGWIRQVVPFTDDLDKVSDELFKLKTGGSEEYCGAAIDRALKELEWNTENPDALKLVFIAGNEPFNQGDVDYAPVIARGVAQGITVNTIYCGSATDGDAALWKDGAKKGDGCFFNIDHNAAPPEPETPFDAKLAALGTSLNGTYLAYGSREKRAEKAAVQARQDEYAGALSPAAAVGRATVKANKAAYRNSSWNLVDLYEGKGIRAVEELGEAGALPEELGNKSGPHLEKAVKAKAAERSELQKKIAETAKWREAWLDKWKAEQGASRNGGAKTLDDAVIQAVRRQAAVRKFSFVEENGGQNNPPVNKEQK